MSQDAFFKFLARCYTKNLSSSIKIPKCIHKIGELAFSGCTSLMSIDIPDTVTRIERKAFYGCSSLISVNVPASVREIEFGAFQDCSSLPSMNIPNSIVHIHAMTFSGCTLLKSINIPRSVVIIGASSFQECASLQSIDIPDSVQIIEHCAFLQCIALVSITLPNSIISFGSYVFSECSSLRDVSISASITAINAASFYQCSALSSINIPNTITYIAYEAFSHCVSLTSIIIPESVRFIGSGAFRSCSSLTSIKIPNFIERIGNQAFRNCTSLTSITIPLSAATEIGICAFYECEALEQREANGYNNHVDTGTWLQQRFGNLPIHRACYDNTNTLTVNTLENLISQHAVSMLTSTDSMLMTPLHVLCSNPNATIEMIKLLKVAQPDAALMQNVMDKTPLRMLLECKSERYHRFHDKDGQLLPLVKLLQQGLDFDALEMILGYDNSMPELWKIDDTSGLSPFMYGASLVDTKLDVVYEMAMNEVDLMAQF
jgi:hypothetical protein